MNDNHKVIIETYDKNWPERYKQEINIIREVLKSAIGESHHIGSTAIPNMPAKPVIDIVLELNDPNNISDIRKELERIGYSQLTRSIIPHRSFFTFREENKLRFHLHIFERGDPQIKRHVNFRDYVISHPQYAMQYAQLKLRLAEEFPNDIYGYVSAKSKLVQEIDAQAKICPWRRQHFLAPITGLPAKEWTYEKIVTAMEANLNVHMTHFSQYLDQDLIRIPGYTIVNSNLTDDTFNYVIDADFIVEQSDSKIKEVNDYFKEKSIPYSWWISPNDKPQNLAEFLVHNNFKNTENNTAMYLDLDDWDPEFTSIPGLEIIRATNEKTLHDFALVLANDKLAFKEYFSRIAKILTNDDPIEYYVGYVNGKPVVRGLSCYYGGVVGLHWLSTSPDDRKKGYGTAMQRFRLKRAKELGYHIAVLQASAEGFPLYQKLGYKECGSFNEYKWGIT